MSNESPEPQAPARRPTVPKDQPSFCIACERETRSTLAPVCKSCYQVLRAKTADRREGWVKILAGLFVLGLALFHPWFFKQDRDGY